MREQNIPTRVDGEESKKGEIIAPGFLLPEKGTADCEGFIDKRKRLQRVIEARGQFASYIIPRTRVRNLRTHVCGLPWSYSKDDLVGRHLH